MPAYSKLCVICTKEFMCQRISTVYCSKKCANRARVLPHRILESLMQRAQQFTMKNIIQLRSTRIAELKNASVENPLGTEYNYVMAQALMEAEKRGIKQKTTVDMVEENEENMKKDKPEVLKLTKHPDLPTLGELKDSNLIDPEMMEFNLDETIKDNLKFIYTTDQADGNADGFGVGTDGSIKNEVLPQPRVSKLRRVGEK